jgi:uncharacterized protein YbjT (DUF2867 family)
MPPEPHLDAQEEETMSILITGGTGGVGGEIVRQLLEREPRGALRVSTRDPVKAKLPAGVEVFAGDLNDASSMARAFDGATKVFLYAHGGDAPALAALMKRSGVEQVVLLSTIDVLNLRESAKHNRRRHLQVEQAIAESGIRHTFLRPGAFATNALRFWSRSIAAEGVVRLPYPEAQEAPIDERDIAAVAVHALATRDLDHQGFVLTGPESLTQRAQVEIIGAAIGRPLRIETVDPAEARAALGRIIPPLYVDLLLAQWSEEVGVHAEVNENVRRFTGRAATPYREWAARNAAAFQGVTPT